MRFLIALLFIPFFISCQKDETDKPTEIMTVVSRITNEDDHGNLTITEFKYNGNLLEEVIEETINEISSSYRKLKYIRKDNSSQLLEVRAYYNQWEGLDNFDIMVPLYNANNEIIRIYTKEIYSYREIRSDYVWNEGRLVFHSANNDTLSFSYENGNLKNYSHYLAGDESRYSSYKFEYNTNLLNWHTYVPLEYSLFSNPRVANGYLFCKNVLKKYVIYDRWQSWGYTGEQLTTYDYEYITENGLITNFNAIGTIKDIPSGTNAGPYTYTTTIEYVDIEY